MCCLYWTGYQTRSQFFANKQQILHGRKVSRFRQLIIYILPSYESDYFWNIQEHELLSIGFFGPFDIGNCTLYHAKISLSTPT